MDKPVSADEWEQRQLDHFTRTNSNVMRERLNDGAKKFGALSWRQMPYSDADNLVRLHRAVDHLEGVLRKWRDAEINEFIDVVELRKRAADVANQAFMLADIQRKSDD